MWGLLSRTKAGSEDNQSGRDFGVEVSAAFATHDTETNANTQHTMPLAMSPQENVRLATAVPHNLNSTKHPQNAHTGEGTTVANQL